MKTQGIFSKTRRLPPLLLVAVFALFSLSCEQKKWGPHPETQEGNYHLDEFQIQSFKITSEARTIDVFDGALELEFPAGGVESPTMVSISSYPCTQVNFDGHNMMMCALGIEIGENQTNLLKSASMKMSYNLNRFLNGAPESETKLTIYRVYPDIYNPVYIQSLNDCCVDTDCKTISSCIERGGNYIVGVK